MGQARSDVRPLAAREAIGQPEHREAAECAVVDRYRALFHVFCVLSPDFLGFRWPLCASSARPLLLQARL